MRKKMKFQVLFAGGLILTAIASTSIYLLSKAPQREMKKRVLELMGMNINICFENSEAYRNGTYSTYTDSGMKKLIVYVDSSYCTHCFIHNLSDYYAINDTLSSKNVELVIVMHPQKADIKDVRVSINKDSIPFWCIIDSEGEFNSKNINLSDNHLLNSFLLNERNDIILIGNPVRNPRVKELLYKTLKIKS